MILIPEALYSSFLLLQGQGRACPRARVSWKMLKINVLEAAVREPSLLPEFSSQWMPQCNLYHTASFPGVTNKKCSDEDSLLWDHARAWSYLLFSRLDPVIFLPSFSNWLADSIENILVIKTLETVKCFWTHNDQNSHEAKCFRDKSRDFAADLGPEHTTGTLGPGHAITPHSANKCCRDTLV